MQYYRICFLSHCNSTCTTAIAFCTCPPLNTHKISLTFLSFYLKYLYKQFLMLHVILVVFMDAFAQSMCGYFLLLFKCSWTYLPPTKKGVTYCHDYSCLLLYSSLKYFLGFFFCCCCKVVKCIPYRIYWKIWSINNLHSAVHCTCTFCWCKMTIIDCIIHIITEGL